MPKQSLEVIQNSISTFDLNSSEDKLSHGFKVAKTQQEFHKQQSEEFKLLEKFKSSILKRIKSLRTTPSIEELDAIEQTKPQFDKPDITARDEGVED